MTEDVLSLAGALLKAMKAERDGNSFYLMAANSRGRPTSRFEAWQVRIYSHVAHSARKLFSAKLLRFNQEG